MTETKVQTWQEVQAKVEEIQQRFRKEWEELEKAQEEYGVVVIERNGGITLTLGGEVDPYKVDRINKNILIPD